MFMLGTNTGYVLTQTSSWRALINNAVADLPSSVTAIAFKKRLRVFRHRDNENTKIMYKISRNFLS